MPHSDASSFVEKELISKTKSVAVDPDVNKPIDALDGIPIYYNGGISKTYGRNMTNDGYNLGLKWQCVEFVKRYYYVYFNHKMPNSYGHAKDFFDTSLGNAFNADRGMQQHLNGHTTPPSKRNIIVFKGDNQNPYGHIAIISSVHKDHITIAQQNWGKQTKMNLPLMQKNGQYFVSHKNVVGWLSL